MQRPENSNLYCCFLAWRLAGYISRRLADKGLGKNKSSRPAGFFRVSGSMKKWQ
jgi:hypothetical protein